MGKEKLEIIVINKKSSLSLVKDYIKDFSDEVIEIDQPSSEDSQYLLNITSTSVSFYTSPRVVDSDIIVGTLIIPSIKNLPGFTDNDRILFEYNAFEDSSDPIKYEVYKNQISGELFIIINTVESTMYKFFIRNNTIKEQDLKLFTFNLNPNHIVPSYRKITTEIKTRGGWEVQHWGNSLAELSVQGKSGGLFTNIINKKADVTQSLAWKKLRELHQIYLNFNSKANTQYNTTLALSYRNMIYVGYFTGFDGPKANELNPLIVDYSFTFKIIEEVNF